MLLEPDLSYTVTILIIVVTVNAVNFIDGLDGLAAGVVGISALAFMVYSYTLTNSVGIPSQSVPAVDSAVLAGVCIGFLPHNFNPARIFMGDTGAMLLGLLLAYGPISSTASLDKNILVNYASSSPVDRFATILPLLLPIAILIIPYTDLLLAVVRRMAKGQSPFAADRQHLHHRLQNMGHSHRQTVLLMYLWAALFSGTVVGLSVHQGPADLAGPGHRRRDGRAGARDDAEAPPVAVDRQARGRDQKPSPGQGHPGPFDRTGDRHHQRRPRRSGGRRRTPVPASAPAPPAGADRRPHVRAAARAAPAAPPDGRPTPPRTGTGRRASPSRHARNAGATRP